MDHMTEHTIENFTRELLRIYEKFGYLIEKAEKEGRLKKIEPRED